VYALFCGHYSDQELLKVVGSKYDDEKFINNQWQKEYAEYVANFNVNAEKFFEERHFNCNRKSRELYILLTDSSESKRNTPVSLDDFKENKADDFMYAYQETDFEDVPKY